MNENCAVRQLLFNLKNIQNFGRLLNNLSAIVFMVEWPWKDSPLDLKLLIRTEERVLASGRDCGAVLYRLDRRHVPPDAIKGCDLGFHKRLPAT